MQANEHGNRGLVVGKVKRNHFLCRLPLVHAGLLLFTLFFYLFVRFARRQAKEKLKNSYYDR